jgi:hypothetical protein
LWLAILVLAALWLSQVRTEGTMVRGWPLARAVLMSTAVIAMVASAVVSGHAGVSKSNERRDQLEPARRALITGSDDALLSRLYPSAREVKRRRQLLITWHLSVFRSADAQQDRAMESR